MRSRLLLLLEHVWTVWRDTVTLSLTLSQELRWLRGIAHHVCGLPGRSEDWRGECGRGELLVLMWLLVLLKLHRLVWLLVLLILLLLHRSSGRE